MSAGNGVCNTIYGDNATALTVNAWSIFQDYANRGYTLASSQINGLTQFNVAYLNWDASWTTDPTLSGFHRPTRPDLVPISPIDTSGTVPDVPNLSLTPIVLENVPVEPTQLSNIPELNLTVSGPDPVTDARPGASPVVVIPDAPDAPAVNLDIAVPTLLAITVPDAPVIAIDPFDELPPEFTAPVPSGAVDFTESPYVSALLDGIKARITTMMAGEGLPPACAAAIYGRLTDRDDASAIKLHQEVFEDFASRGFDAEPNGLLARRSLEARQANRTARAGSAREVYVQEQTVIVENVRFAVSNGIQLEGQLIQAHLAIEQRKFELVVKAQDLAIAVFGANVQAYNARVAGFNARVDAYKAFLEGQKAKVEVYKSEVEAAKVTGELNVALVNAYEAQIRAEVTKVEVYKAQIEGFRARIEGERTKIEVYRSQIEAFASFVDAYKAEWDAERIRIEAEVQRGQIYETLTKVYAARVGVWQTKAQVSIQEQQADIQVAQQYLAQHDAQIKTLLAKLEASKATLQAQIAQQDAQVRIYQADAGVEATASDVDTRIYQALVAKEDQRLQILLKDVELRINQINQNAGLLLRAMESAATASTQLTASALSAVNFSAGVSSGISHSDSCNSSFSFSGSIADAP